MFIYDMYVFFCSYLPFPSQRAHQIIQLEPGRVGMTVDDLRAALHVHGSDLGPEPAHGLQGGVVVAQLGAAAHEVLPLKDHHTAALVRLWRRRGEGRGETQS